MQSKLAVQLYTLREACSSDFHQVLRDLKAMGWGGVQLAGYHGHAPAELAAFIQETGLQVAGMHVSLGRIKHELEELVHEAGLFGTRDIICPSLPVEMRNEAGYREARELLNKAAEAVKPTGIRISYHNHSFEFEETVDGQFALEYMLKPSADNLVLAELDVFWVKKAGQEIEHFIALYANRMPIIHLKDMTADDRRTFAPIGSGIIDFTPILHWGEQNGIEWYVVEQDECDSDPMACVASSYRYLAALISGMGAKVG
ncbi:sugar phosphate isomerase/epimerase [Paenibacillus sp. J5C_2022]|uniref:sugar phosphate isomerase/epimerase family protein n=1 Tax=Paenibacillus sp. J5C2022 TaxID=2977129 RepID=UPI0021D3A5A7|nr:sugar phosphate isomerase/epimerase [Paenibacillus sp. J5C2022]MCU6709923.1 sugar phosphate isomerase/epimerase [Paenibacillus sp. J5C2022]